MIRYIKGTLIQLGFDRIIVEVNGIGYQILVPATILSMLPPPGKEVMLHTSFQVREDAMTLYGFLQEDELEIFQLLIHINGIGPKAALSILSTLSTQELRFAVLSGDDKAIAKTPGIGNKTAQKVILELKDKLDVQEALENSLTVQRQDDKETMNKETEVVLALNALGYSDSESLRAVRQVEQANTMNTEELLKAALKKIAF